MAGDDLQKTLDLIDVKRAQLDELRLSSSDYLKNLEEWFRVELTYNSNAIEGNTLTRSETALIINKGITAKGKTLVEHLEAVNHAEAIDYVRQLVDGTSKTKRVDLLNLHKLVLHRIDDRNAGQYRTFNVAISGSDVELPDHLTVPELMDKFVAWIHRSSKSHPIIKAADAHYKLVRIHPFVDGNGRTARLLMNLLLMQSGHPITVIGNDQRADYIDALEKADTTEKITDFYLLISKAVDKSLDIYLGNKKPRGVKEGRLLKIGQLAELTNLSTSKIRYWTTEGLLKPSETSDSGYRWYSEDAVHSVERIKELQAQRLTLEEIRKELEANRTISGP